MRTSYALLVIFIGLSLAFYAIWLEVGWVKDWTAQIGGGLVTSLVVILLIDRILESQRQRERKKVRDVAVAQLRRPLMRQLQLLGNWYKAAVSGKPEALPSTVTGFFGEDFYEQIRWLDFAKTGPTIAETSWLQYSANELKRFQDDLERVIDKYATFLEPSTIELLERLRDSPVASIVILSVNLPDIDRQHGWPRQYNFFESVVTLVRQHVEAVLELLDYVNAGLEEPITLESLALLNEGTAPAFGSGRLAKTVL